jgi:hypothetical protein
LVCLKRIHVGANANGEQNVVNELNSERMAATFKKMQQIYHKWQKNSQKLLKEKCNKFTYKMGR